MLRVVLPLVERVELPNDVVLFVVPVVLLDEPETPERGGLVCGFAGALDLAPLLTLPETGSPAAFRALELDGFTCLPETK